MPDPAEPVAPADIAADPAALRKGKQDKARAVIRKLAREEIAAIEAERVAATVPANAKKEVKKIVRRSGDTNRPGGTGTGTGTGKADASTGTAALDTGSRFRRAIFGR